jgi:hypothetical protein
MLPPPHPHLLRDQPMEIPVWPAKPRGTADRQQSPDRDPVLGLLHSLGHQADHTFLVMVM